MKTVLVVDDEPKIVQLARDYLEHAGFSVASASDGREALASFRASAPDLLVLDLGLPLVDGLDVARAIRKTSNVPIVMLTGRGDEADRVSGLELGADDYVTKPFSPKELVARVRAVLRTIASFSIPLPIRWCSSTSAVLDARSPMRNFAKTQRGTLLTTLRHFAKSLASKNGLFSVAHGEAR